MRNAFPDGVVRLSSVLAAAFALVIAASSYAAAQTPPHEAHHPDGVKEAAPMPEPKQEAQSRSRGGMMGGMMQPGDGTMGMMQGDGMMGGMVQGRGMMEIMRDCPMMGGATATHAEGRIAFLKAELAITDQQKEAWEAYAAAIKKNLDGMQVMRETMMTVMQAKSPVERLDAHIGAMDARVAALKEIKPALANLYAALSDEQKKKADELLTGMGCMM